MEEGTSCNEGIDEYYTSLLGADVAGLNSRVRVFNNSGLSSSSSSEPSVPVDRLSPMRWRFTGFPAVANTRFLAGEDMALPSSSSFSGDDAAEVLRAKRRRPPLEDGAASPESRAERMEEEVEGGVARAEALGVAASILEATSDAVDEVLPMLTRSRWRGSEEEKGISKSSTLRSTGNISCGYTANTYTRRQ